MAAEQEVQNVAEDENDRGRDPQFPRRYKRVAHASMKLTKVWGVKAGSPTAHFYGGLLAMRRNRARTKGFSGEAATRVPPACGTVAS